MTKFTLSVFRFFKKHKGAFYSTLILSTLIFAFFASKINFEEDITKLLPSTTEGGTEELVFSNLKVKDKIFILFNPLDSTVDADRLIEAGDEFVEALLEKDTISSAIHDILYLIDESLIYDGISFLYENVPVFLDSSHYRLMDAITEASSIEKQMGNNYATMRSSSGSAFKDVITHDPIGVRNVFLDEMGGMQNSFGGNYAFYSGHLFTADTSILIAFLSPNFKSFDSKLGARLTEMIEDEVRIFQKDNPDIEVLYHGAPLQSVHNSRRIKKDLMLTISISLILIMVLLLICFRNKSTILYLLCPIIYGVLFALAIVFLIKGSMSLMAMGIGAIVMGVAFSYCIHVITHYKYVSDPEIVIKDQALPVVLGSVTTIGAFAGLLLTKSELLQDFGLFASLGIVGTTIFCLLFLPQFFNPHNNKRSEKAFAVLEKINSFPFEKQKWLIILILVVSAICFVASGKVRFDSDLRNIGYDDERIVRSRDLLAAKTTGNYATVYFASVAENLDSALILNRQLCRRLDEQVSEGAIVGYSNPATFFIPTDEQEERIERWNRYWTPEKRTAVKDEILKAGTAYKFNPATFTPFFELLDNDYRPISLYDAEILPEGLINNIIEYTDGRYLVFTPVQMDKTLLMEVSDNVVKDDPAYVVIDPMYYTNDMVRLMHDDFNTILTISSLFVLFILLISYQSIVLALIAFLPMGLSWYIVLGFMAIFGMEFNLINIVIATFIFGIGVDYSIFIMDGLLTTYRTGRPTLVYHKTAIFFSAVILIVVITSLLFAVHPAISSIGAATLVGMGATILIAYSLQPFLFSLLVSNRTAKGKAPFSILGLVFPMKSGKRKDALMNNYVYKGNSVERQLHRELRKTNSYRLIADVVSDSDSMLDYGCGYGFCCYGAAVSAPQLCITGYDCNAETIAIADRCFEKTERMEFTTEPSALTVGYEVVIVNKEIATEAVEPEELLSRAKVVIIRNEIRSLYADAMEQWQFKAERTDTLFTAYIKK